MSKSYKTGTLEFAWYKGKANLNEEGFSRDLNRSNWNNEDLKRRRVERAYEDARRNYREPPPRPKYTGPMPERAQYKPPVPYNPEKVWTPEPEAKNMTIEGVVTKKSTMSLSNFRKLSLQAQRGIRIAFVLAKKANKLLDFATWLLEAYNYYEEFEPAWRYHATGWTHCSAYSACRIKPAGYFMTQNSGCAISGATPACLGGQSAPANYSQIGSGVPDSQPNVDGVQVPITRITFIGPVSELNRTSFVRQFHRPVVAGQMEPKFRNWAVRTRDPNIMRLVNTTPQPIQAPRPDPKPSEYVTPTAVVVTRTEPNGPRKPPPPKFPQHISTPPRIGREKDHQKGKAGRLGKLLADALDNLSEGAEVVTAIYEALPDSVKKRWKCGDLDRPGDQMGQYGIEGADCKMQALYHNWHKVNVQQALTNILVNQLEDKLYGEAYKARDRIRPRNLAKPVSG